MDPHKRKILFICAGILFGSNVIRFIGNSALQNGVSAPPECDHRTPESHCCGQKGERGRSGALCREFSTNRPTNTPCGARPGHSETRDRPGFQGARRDMAGGLALPKAGALCSLRFTIQQRDEAFLGNSKMTCNFVTPLMSARDRNDRKLQLQARLNPGGANLTGLVHNGAIEFGIDKVLGKDIHGCEISTFTITPAGAQEIDAAWTERNCSGGHIMLRKMRGY